MPSREAGQSRKGDPASPRDAPRYKSSRAAQLPDQDTPTKPVSSRSSPRKDKPPARRDSNSSASSSASRSKRHVKLVLPEMERRAAETRSSSVPYPSFSKAHSREAVRSVDSVPLKDPLTPDATDLSNSQNKQKSSTPPPPPAAAPATASANGQTRGQAPPSPPLTAVESGDLQRADSRSSMRQAAHDAKQTHARRKSADNDTLYSLRKAEEGSSGLKASTARPTASSKSSLRSLFQGRSGMASGKKSPLKATASSKKPSSSNDSDVTPLAERRSRTSKYDPLADSSASDRESSRPQKQRIQSRGAPQTSNDRNASPVIEVFTSFGSESDVDRDVGMLNAEGPLDTTAAAPPPPPPPPPPPALGVDTPRVDYLLQHGGLPDLVPKDFGSAVSSSHPQPYQQYMSPRLGGPKTIDVTGTFAPFHALLDSYSSVISKNGSIAVATGYKSVARRLLDRLENVFSRNISSELCPCVLCKSVRLSNPLAEDDTGVSWGEVLELVSGRRELPVWPPFSLPTSGLGVSLSPLEPMQKLDVDVPEEYREHYIRQSKKTKQAVDKWLATQPEDHATPPQEVDDETLTFAMLTYLEPEQRRTLTALLRGWTTIPDSRAPTPAHVPGPRLQLLARTGLALQRLYRLPRPPRDPECAMYLLSNRNLHSALATLAAISQQEWDILISGRFDGFLWSGVEDQDGSPSGTPLAQHPLGVVDPFQGKGFPATTKLPFRAATPHSPTKSGSTPMPVQMDEETEVAVLAEVEREIYLGMEALEDAFETLHSKAETVRNALRQRGAGLALQAQRRQSSVADDGPPKARLGTPSMNGGPFPSDPSAPRSSFLHGDRSGFGDEDDGMFDGRSELAPDDSASNVGWKSREKRARYKKRRDGTSRRTERRTPAPVEEEDEDEPPPPPRSRR